MKLNRKYIFIVSIIFCFIIILELAFRITYKHISKNGSRNLENIRKLIFSKEERLKIKYKPHPYLCFTPENFDFYKNHAIIYGKKYNYKHNTTRIICLGGSTTAPAKPIDYSFPSYLSKKLKKNKYEVINCGVPAWTSLESLIFLLINGIYLNPNVIIFHHNVNDITPMEYNNYKIDYSNYRKAWGKKHLGIFNLTFIKLSKLYTWFLMKKGILNIDINFFVRNNSNKRNIILKKIVKDNITFKNNIIKIIKICSLYNIKLILTTMPFNENKIILDKEFYKKNLIANNNYIKKIAKESNTALCAWDEADGSIKKEYFLDLIHLNKHGNKEKAELLMNLL